MKSAKRNILRRFCLYTNSPLNNSLFAKVAFFKIIPIFVAIYPKEKTMKSTIRSIWNFYTEGFRQMTWGKNLWLLILLKLIFLFAILRMFFFRPTLSGKSEEEKIEHVGMQLTRPITDNNNKQQILW